MMDENRKDIIYSVLIITIGILLVGGFGVYFTCIGAIT